MKTRLLQLFFVLSQPKLYAHFKILFSLILFKEGIGILFLCIVFGEIHLPTYLHNYTV